MSISPFMIRDTAESLRRDFEQNMRAPATPHSQAIRQHPLVALDPRLTLLAPRVDHRSGHEPIFPIRDQGRESSARHRPSASKPYDSVALPKKSQRARNDESLKETQVDPSTAGPPSLVLVPQEDFSWLTGVMPPIDFTPKEWHDIGIDPVRRSSAKHRIENSKDKVLGSLEGLREIQMIILWPGYPHDRYPIAIRINDAVNVTRGELLDLICGAVFIFADLLKVNYVRVREEHAEWMIGPKGLKVDTFFIARLLHRGGNYFQPEIWVPRPSEKSA